ncbi:MAG TPA: 4-hydroxy-tetrahydrodipicolinate synthase [bacterium]|nr:4-hydroxy-tetrahydrodipicolinate synthase [bacterium]
MFEGTLTALITPMREGAVDEDALRRLVDWQIGEGIHGLVPSGTTGESSTMSYAEHERVVELVVEQAGGRVPVLAGTGSNSTWETIKLTRHAAEAGAQGALLITPYYNRPTQEGLYRHFETVAKAVDIPIVLYNVPSRTGVNLLPETVGRLSRIDNIIGLKDAAGSIKQTLDTLEACGGELVLLSGDDFANLSLLSIGGKGAISVTANVAPALSAELYNAWEQGDADRARELQQKLHPLNHAMFLETNPIPVKWAAHRLGLCGDEIRLPLTVLTEQYRPKVEKAMKDLGLI